MSTELSDQPQIDRLSSLPPELLSTIFDLAHDPEEPLREPLSKTLLPYFRQNLYREIRISSSSSLPKLLETVKSHPSLGFLVFSLDTSKIYKDEEGHRPLKKLLRYLPSLRSLSIHHVLSFSPNYDNLPLLASNLESISFTCMSLCSSGADILSRITGLKSVAISFSAFDNKSEPSQAGIHSKSCNNVQKLSIAYILDYDDEDVPICTEEFAQFVDKFFPRITYLCLKDDNYPDYRSFLSNLDTGATSIESLALHSDTLLSAYNISSQHLLPRFKNLKHLELGEGTVSSPLAIYLRQLPHLQSLELAAGTHLDGLTLEDLLSVIDGPSRTESLEVLVVNSINEKMKIGRRIDSSDAAVELGSHTLVEDGWVLSLTDDWDLEDLEPIFQAGAVNGIEVRGTSLEALKVWRALKLEKANRLILRAYRTKSLDEYIAEKEFGWVNPFLPDLDIDKLDPKNLKLVKIDLLDEGWHQFSLASAKVVEEDEEYL